MQRAKAVMSLVGSFLAGFVLVPRFESGRCQIGVFFFLDQIAKANS
jgi:hypothetical protein